MIQVIAHRGVWNELEEKNSLVAFQRAIEMGVGIETDIRDFCGRLVVSHDIPSTSSLDLIATLNEIAPECILNQLPICLNIKSDGMAYLLEEILSQYKGLDYYVFDASIPELIKYQKMGIPFLHRLSEYEDVTTLLETSAGIWLDQFKAEPLDEVALTKVLSYSKKTFIVSPELHGHEYHKLWNSLLNISTMEEIYLCTDAVEEALRLFGEETFED